MKKEELLKRLKELLSQAEEKYDEPFLDEFERGVQFGKIEAYEGCIELLKEYKIL